ncbi:response regulator [soil metagenome]
MTVDLLLVEDSPFDAELSLLALKEQNLPFTIHWVKDGEEALQYIFAEGPYADRNIKEQPKVVLLDIKMPKVNGIEVLTKIRSDERTKGIPVVMLTSSKQDSDIITCYELGANSFITKPVEFGEFTKTIATVGFYWMILNNTPGY